MENTEHILNILTDQGLLKKPLGFVFHNSGQFLVIKSLATQGLVDEQEATKCLAHMTETAYFDLSDSHLIERLTPDKYLIRISAHFCWERKIIPLYDDHDVVIVAMANPLDLDALNQIKFALGVQVRPVACEETKISRLLTKFYMTPLSLGDDTAHASSELLLDTSSISEDTAVDVSDEDQAPIIRLVNRVITQAVHSRASDIHFDPTADGLDIRFRIDGVMQHILDAAKRNQRTIISRLKLLAGMDISQHRVPQDGRIRVLIADQPIDLRVSCLPTAYGEKVVIRILNTNFDALNFSSLGLPTDIEETLCETLKTPGRMVLVTGPTGSGKTTTLYTGLKFLTDGTTNIETVEDPIEYKIPGINQVQVNSSSGVTFTSALRSILRQDPDVIMIGEIRDRETADIALQSAQTGHTVLSTLHTNDAPSAVTRLLSLGCDAFVLASSLAGVLAQRLVRKICPKCKTRASKAVLKRFAKIIQRYQIDSHYLQEGLGCEHCRSTGYSGRVGIYSYLAITAQVAEMIEQHASLNRIIEAGILGGYRSLDANALQLLLSGQTSISEVASYLNQEHPEIQVPFREISQPNSIDPYTHSPCVLRRFPKTQKSSL
jgi:type IV pilus assembly protein PilB